MIRKINRGQDIIDTITGEVGKIKEVRYYTHTDPSNYIHGNESYEGTDVMKIRLCSEDLAELSDGQLICEVHLEESDSEFCDGKQKTIIKEEFEVWIA